MAEAAQLPGRPRKLFPPMSLHKEISFESEICEHLAEHGWLYAEGDAADYDRARALFPADVLAWVQATQPKAWETLTKNHGAQAGETLLARLRDQLDQRGTLDVLRHGIELLGLKSPLKLASSNRRWPSIPTSSPATPPTGCAWCARLRYSLHNENSIDLGLFLNGLPVATAELKTDFTQSINDAIDQYRFDRNPKPKGQAAGAAAVLSQRGAGALCGEQQRSAHGDQAGRPGHGFLPFNLGDDGAAGNPVNPEGGHRTAYLWEKVWARESWLEILGRYLIAQRDKKKQIREIIFPRYHQLDVTRKLQAAVLKDGPGGKYLIQHSAGSGKTNSIAWTAHFLAELHDVQHKKVFDTVLVVSDRNVIDAQLQEALFDFQRTSGVVATITNKDGSKSGKLAEALSGDKKIVVCTIQTFPFALEAVRELAATQGKRFAVIADEAHSSQTGEAAAKLKAVLSPEELAELNDGGEVSTEDILAAQMAARAAEGDGRHHLRRLHRHAEEQDPGDFRHAPRSLAQTRAGQRARPLPCLFHAAGHRGEVHPRCAAELHALQARLQAGPRRPEMDDKEVERSAALKRIMGWVRLHPYNIAQKVEVVVEHFRATSPRCSTARPRPWWWSAAALEAVRWQLAIDKYIKEHGYKIGTLVAFSGEVNDKESGPDGFTENSPALNPNLKGRDIREAFKGDEYQILLVANKFQTGFDQPLLCGMYVDKRLAGIQAVQTLSRLNRAWPGKDTTYVVDFVNDTGKCWPPSRPTTPRRAGDHHGSESGFQPACQARCRRPLRRLRGGSRGRGGAEPERQAKRADRRAGAGAGPRDEALQGARQALKRGSGQGRRTQPPRRHRMS
jgi:type I restriction enzyme R subunit